MKYVYGVKYNIFNYKKNDHSIGVGENIVVFAREVATNKVKHLLTFPFDYQLFDDLRSRIDDINMSIISGEKIKINDVPKLIKKGISC